MPTNLDVDAGVVVVRALGPMLEDNDDTNTSSTIDLAPYPGYRVMLIGGTGSWTDGAFTFSVEQSHDDSTYVALAPYSGSLTAVGAANTTREAAYSPTRRYLQVKCVAASTTDGAIITAYLLLLPRSGL